MSRADTTQNYEYDFGPDEYRGFEIRDDESGRGPLILTIAVLVLLIFAAVIWNTYRQGVRPADGALPIIAADDAPYKRAPDERGGLQVAGQENGFYGQMDGMGDPALVEKAAVRNPVEIRRETPVLAGGVEDLPPVPEATQPPIITANVTETAQPATSAALEGLDPRQPEASDLAEVKTAARSGPIDLKPKRETPEVVDVLPEPALPEPSIIASRFDPLGAFQVQIMAVRSEDAARKEWGRLQSDAPTLYTNAKLNIQRADLGAKGVFYRLRVGSFDTRENAKGFCNDVKATGRDCIVVKASG